MIANPMLRRLLTLVALSAAASGCLESSSGPVEPSVTAEQAHAPSRVLGSAQQATGGAVSAVIGSAGGTLNIPGGHSLYFPPGALAGPTLIRAVPLGGGTRIVVGPHGLVFPKSARPTLTLSYAGSTSLSDADADRMAIVYLDPSGVRREVLPTKVDTSADVARARLRHFSTYALVTD